MTLISSAAGIALILLVVVDMYREVVQPNSSGAISLRIARFNWKLFHLISPKGRLLSKTAPLAMVTAIGLWIAGMVMGWALVIWPQLPMQFTYGPGVSAKAGFIDAVYVSMVTLATLGYGDIVPSHGWLRVMLPVEAFLGFGLLSAATSWVLAIYPPISRRHFLAHELATFRQAQESTGLRAANLSPDIVAGFLGQITSQAISVRSDTVQFPILYYVHTTELRSSLPAQLPFLLAKLTEYAAESYPNVVNFHAARLGYALDDLCGTLAGFLPVEPEAPTSEVVAAYAKDHAT